MDLFGFEIKKKKPAGDVSAGIVMPENDDGSTVAVSSGSAFFGVYLDVDAITKNEALAIQSYRDVASYPEVDLAIQDIVNEAIPHEDDSPQVELIMDELEFSDTLKNTFTEEFKTILQKLNFSELSSDIFRRWYVDGKLYYQILIDKTNTKRGIVELRPIEATKIKKVKEVKKKVTTTGVPVIDTIEEYFVFNENGFAGNTNTSTGNYAPGSALQGVKLSPDAVLYCTSGLLDPTGQSVISYLQKAVRPVNQLRMMEDSLVVYRIARAPERRIFYIDVGSLPKGKAEQYMTDIMNRYRNKMVYDAKTGTVRDDKKYMSMLEDFWLPRRDGGKGTEIQTLPGAQNLGTMDDVVYFQQKVYQSLNVPISRLNPENEGFAGIGRTTEVSRDELKFQKFIDKLRRKFSILLLDALKTQLILKGVCNDLEWEEIRDKIRIRYQKDNVFSEMKNLDILTSRMMILPQVDQYLGKYFSKAWVQKKVLQMTDEDIKEMDVEISAEEGDPTAQPTIPGMPPGMDPSMMGQSGDPSMGGQQGYPFPQDGGDQQDGQDQQYQ